MDRGLLIKAGERLTSWQRTMILTHLRPDGDGLGGIGAMKQVIESCGRQATAYIHEDVPTSYQFLAHSCNFNLWPEDNLAEFDKQFDGILIVDTCSWQQLEKVADYLKDSSLPRVIIDHHQTNDDLAIENSKTLYVIDPTAASACVMIHEWCEVMNWPIDPVAAKALFTGITTDTGWFRFSNTDARTFKAASALIEKDIHPDHMYATLYASYSVERIKLMAAMLSTLQFHADGALAVMWITKQMFEQTGAQNTDTENLVNYPMEAKSVVVTVLLTDMGDGQIRINFRSKSLQVCERDIDVSAIAAQFGGGGHARASGARVKGSLDEIRDRVIGVILPALNT